MRERLIRRIEQPVRKVMKDGSKYFGRDVWGPSEADRTFFNGLHDFNNDEGGGIKIVAAVAAVAATGAVWAGQPLVDAMSNHGPAAEVRSATGPTPSPTPTETPVPSPSVKINQAPTPTPNSGACPDVETGLQTNKEVGGFTIAGFPDRAINVLRADKDSGFNAEIPQLVLTLAEPGAILYEADIVDRGTANNPYGEGRQNPGADALYGSKGHARFLSAETHAILDTCGPVFRLIPASGLFAFNGQEGVIEIGKSDEKGHWVSLGQKITVKEEQGTQGWVLIRGKFGNGQQDADNNLIARITNYVPSSAQVFEFFPGVNPDTGNVENSAYISVEWFMQNVATAHMRGPNGGDAGNSRVKTIEADTNTGAYEAAVHTSTRDNARNWHNMKNGWNQTGDNFR